MKILLAPNAFKESLSARDAALAMSRGLRAALPQADLILMPVADGGDGMADVFYRALGGMVLHYDITGPMGKRLRASMLRLAGIGPPTYVIEVAEACGLRLVPPKKRDPLIASTRGLGELIQIARKEGARRIIIGLGGSATVDGGAGMADALGFQLLDRTGKPILRGGGGLEKLAKIVPPEQWPQWKKIGEKRAKGAKKRVRRFQTKESVRSVRKEEEDELAGFPEIIAASDVNNQLLGKEGAAAVFGPQKGATPAMVKRLETGLRKLSRRIQFDLDQDVRTIEGGGAAGGLGAGLAGFLGARVVSGAHLVLQSIRYHEVVTAVDFVFTGEGRLDSQTLANKAPAVVAQIAAEHGIPTIALAGSVEIGPDPEPSPEAEEEGDKKPGRGFTACFPIVPGPMSLKEAMAQTPELIEKTAYEVGRLIAIQSISRPTRRRRARRKKVKPVLEGIEFL